MGKLYKNSKILRLALTSLDLVLDNLIWLKIMRTQQMLKLSFHITAEQIIK